MPPPSPPPRQKGDAEMSLNYGPTDPDKMRLPAGVTCGDCVHIRRCKLIFGHVETDTYCDWSPSRFAAPQPATTQEPSHE
jgi:hypothetical protein